MATNFEMRAESLSFAACQPTTPLKRKNYSREQKLKVLDFYRENGKNLYKTCQHFDLNSKNVLRLLACEKGIRDSKCGSR